MESKKKSNSEAERKYVVARGWGWGKQGDVDKRVQTFSYKMNKV